MEIKIYEKLPVYAVDIRKEVFVKEQGFHEEFDDNDKSAVHLVGFVDDRSAATCRVIKNEDGSYIIGRIAVRKKHRKSGYGSEMVFAAERLIKSIGGKDVFIHSQEQASPFYEKIGYSFTGETDYEEGCLHLMMYKKL